MTALLRCAAVILLLVAAASFLPGHLPTLLSIFSLWVFLPAYALLLGALVVRDPVTAGLAAPAVLLHAALVVPDLAPAQPPPEGPSLHVVSANLLMVHPDPMSLAATLLARDADVLLLQEVSDIWMVALKESGVLAAYPHQTLIAQNDSFGTALLSRLPLTDARVDDLLGVPYTRATVTLDGQPVHLLNIHTLPPRNATYFDRWEAQMAYLTTLVGDGPVAIIGDLNTTQHSAAYRRLLDVGLHGAHRECGQGLGVTFPNGVFPIPPVRLDHALLSEELACTALTPIHGTGSDHSALDLHLTLRKID